MVSSNRNIQMPESVSEVRFIFSYENPCFKELQDMTDGRALPVAFSEGERRRDARCHQGAEQVYPVVVQHSPAFQRGA